MTFILGQIKTLIYSYYGSVGTDEVINHNNENKRPQKSLTQCCCDR